MLSSQIELRRIGDAAFVNVLINWARWCRAPRGGAGACRSIEGWFVRDRDAFNPDDPQSFQSDRPRDPVDVRSALRMNHALSVTAGRLLAARWTSSCGWRLWRRGTHSRELTADVSRHCDDRRIADRRHRSLCALASLHRANATSSGAYARGSADS